MYKSLSKARKALTTGAVALTVFTLTVTPVFAGQRNFFESFNSGFKIQSETRRPTLHGITWGVDGSRSETRNNFPASISNERSGRTKYVNLSISETENPDGNFLLSELAELRTGYTTGEGKWLPKVNRPVVLESRIKWSDNYNLDGSGTATGSSGVWLWNSPVCVEGCDYPAYTSALGFSWNTDASIDFVRGLSFNVVQDEWPVDYTKITTVDLNDWNTYKMVWSVNEAGEQSITSYVNRVEYSSVDLLTPLPELSLEIWNDNTVFTYTGLEFPDVEADQDFMLDYVKINQKFRRGHHHR